MNSIPSDLRGRRDRIYESVTRAGQARRRRRAAALVAVVAACAAVPVAAVAMSSSHDRGLPRVVASDSTSTSTTDSACHNSENSACGPLRYVPPLTNRQPNLILVNVSTQTPRVGEKVTVTMRAVDADSEFNANSLWCNDVAAARVGEVKGGFYDGLGAGGGCRLLWPAARVSVEKVFEIGSFRSFRRTSTLLRYEHMFALLDTARISLNSVASDFDAGALSLEAATRVVDQLGAITRVVDGMLGQGGEAGRRAECRRRVCGGRSVCSGSGPVRCAPRSRPRRSSRSCRRPMRRCGPGVLSAKEATLIADAATLNPAAEAAFAARRASRAWCRCGTRVSRRGPRSRIRSKRRERQHRDRAFRSWTDRDGMWAGSFRYSPEIGAQLKAVIDKRTQRIFRDHKAGTDHEPNDAYAADAVAEFILGDLGRRTAPATNVTVHVVVGNETLKSGELVAGEVCEIPGVGPVDVNWVREQLGTAFVTAIIKNGKDILTVAHFGRHIPAELRPRYSSAAANVTPKAATTAAISNATTSTTTPKADRPRTRTCAGSATATTGSKPAAGSSDHPTPKPANANSDHHRRVRHEIRPRGGGARRRRRAGGPRRRWRRLRRSSAEPSRMKPWPASS